MESPPAFKPGPWIGTEGRAPPLSRDALIFVKGSMEDVFGPVPFEMIDGEAWAGNMLHYSHDLIAYAFVQSDA